MKQVKSPFLWAAADVSARELVVALTTDGDAPPRVQTYPNTPAGHRQLLKQLTARFGSTLITI